MKTSVPVLGALLLLLSSTLGTAEPELKAWLGSAFTIPGEETKLFLWVYSEIRPDRNPQVPRANNLTIRFVEDHTIPRRSREKVYLYEFSVRSYEEGTHTIPAIELSVDGSTLRSQPLELHVNPHPDSFWDTVQLIGQDYRFARAIFMPDRVPYEGETFPAEVKLYLPESLDVADASIAEIEHDGVVAWRFEASAAPFPEWPFRTRIIDSSVRIDGEEYRALCYRSAVTAIRTGPISLGPGQARLSLHVQVPIRGNFRRDTLPRQIPIPKIDFLARPLPPNAPPGFDNAVGRFSISAQAETTGLQEGDHITVRLSVAGSGNLDTLAPPRLDADESDWKVYPPSRLARHGEHRDISGVTTISQIIRPLGPQRVIPPFQLVFFNPRQERYQSVSTPPIPFNVTSSTRAASGPLAVLADISTPVEQMEGILGIIDPSSPAARESTLPWRYWHVIPAALGLLLLLRIFHRHVLPRFRHPRREQEMRRALHAVEQAGPGGREFLRASGNFIEFWIPRTKRDQELEDLLLRRDAECYRPDAEARHIADEDRRHILTLLRERGHAALSALILMLGFAVAPDGAAAALPPEASAPAATALYQQADAAWSQGAYRTAIQFYEKAHPEGEIPADVLFNIGNCHFQLGERGLAALYYHRALLLDPQHPEARQNLGFLKRKTGAITVSRPKHQEVLGRYDRSLFSTVLAAGLWATGLAILAIFSALPQSLRIVAWVGFTSGPLLAVLGAICLARYPTDAEFAPPAEVAIVISAEATEARTEATNSSAAVITVPPGSVCRPLARRGPWTYVELANKTRGWIPSQLVQMVVPLRDPANSSSLDLGA